MSSETNQVAVEEAPSQLSAETPVTPVTPEALSSDWKENLSDEIKADKSLENIKDIEGLAKSYVHAQKLVGADKIPVPNKYATEKDWESVYEKLGRPKTAAEYKYELPENQEINQQALDNFSEQAHKLGLLPGQANGMVKFYNDMMSQGLQEADGKATEARENGTKQLKQEWGQAFEQNISKASTLAKSVMDADFLNTNLADGTKLGDHPTIIKAFANLASKMGEDNITQSSGPAYLTPGQIDKQIGELTQVGSAYWDKNHPNHTASVEEVLSLREKKNIV
tara:strand:+ start:2381 stop:3223 length:843 start_codon:yes stop_codon:yes gene_type:complete